MTFNSKFLNSFTQGPMLNLILKLGAIFTIVLLTMSAAKANNISGRVSLPTGIVAPSGGLSITVRSLLIDDVGFGRDRITIFAGQSAANYVLEFSDDSDRQIVFDCEACALADVTTEGGWSNVDGVVGIFSAQTFSGDRNHIVNIMLETADTFRGTLTLPPGLVARGDEFLFVSISSGDFLAFGTPFSDGEILSEGQTSFDFAIGAPASATQVNWELRFSCLDCEDRIEAESHYATSVIGGAPVLNSGSAFGFMRNSDYSNITLTLIRPVKSQR